MKLNSNERDVCIDESKVKKKRKNTDIEASMVTVIWGFYNLKKIA